MQRREKILAGIVACLLLLWGGAWLSSRVVQAFSARRNQIEALRAEIREKQLRTERGRLAALKIAEWERRSLPSDRELARTLYQNWLLQTVDRIGLSNVSVDAGRGGAHRNVYYKLPFTVRGRGTLEQATRLLHVFYSADHLHQVRDATFTPVDDARQLDMTLAIEALVLPGADRTDRLNAGEAKRLAHGDVRGYVTAIAGRNLFAPYVAPATASSQPPFDPAKYAVLTAVVEVGEVPQAWVNVRTTGELLKLREGDNLRVGNFQATVVRIGATEVEIESGGERRRITLGRPLPEATLVDHPTLQRSEPGGF